MQKQVLTVLLLALAILIPAGIRAQQPEKVVSIVKQVQSFEWYKEQAAAWKKVLDKDPSNAPAWQYYFTANRMARITDRHQWEAGRGNPFMDPDEIVAGAARAIPETFESIYIRIWNQGGDYSGYEKDLFRANELCKGCPEILDELALYYEINRNPSKRKEINKQWFRSNDIPAGILNYNYNVMQTLGDNEILFTGGDMDTYPLWMLQDVQGVKPGVTVLNLSLLANADYRKRIFAELKISDVQVNVTTVQGEDSLFTLKKRIIRQIIEKSNRPVSLAITLDSRYYSESSLGNDLYLTGLVMRYQTTELDNIAQIRRHFENDYLLDYLLAGFSEDPSASVVAQMNTAYLPALIKLCRHYQATGEKEKLARVKRLMNAIALSTGRSDELNSYLNCEQTP